MAGGRGDGGFLSGAGTTADGEGAMDDMMEGAREAAWPAESGSRPLIA